MNKTSTSNTKKSVDTEMIPEVEEFLDIEQDYEVFKEQNQKVIEELVYIAEKRNAALQRADKAVRAQAVSCGPFQLTRAPQRKINVNKLIELVGLKRFKELGGVVSTVPVYEFPTATFERVVASGDLPKEVADVVLTIVPAYSTIDKITIP